MILRTALLLLAWCLVLLGQRSDTVSYQVVSNATGIGQSSFIRNIGQSQHLIWARYSDQGGTCGLSTGSTYLFLEASYDNINFFAISNRQMSVVNDGTYAVGNSIANGSYPFLRVRWTQNWSFCKLDVWYTGTIPPAAYPQAVKALSAGYLRQSASNTAIGSSVVINNLDSGGRVVVYGLWLLNQGTGAVTANLHFAAAPDCAVNTGAISSEIKLGVAGAAHSTAVFPTSLVPYGVGGLGEDVCLALDAAETVIAVVVFRVE